MASGDSQKITFGTSNKDLSEIPEFQPRPKTEETVVAPQYFQYYYYNANEVDIPIVQCNGGFYPPINYARMEPMPPPRGRQYLAHPSYFPIEEIIHPPQQLPPNVQQIYVHPDPNQQFQQTVEMGANSQMISRIETSPVIPEEPPQSSLGLHSTEEQKLHTPTRPLRDARRENLTKPKSRVRSASAGRDRKTEMISRYWAYLFENLERSITEMYNTCERQENIIQCKEVVFMLESYARDFTKLIEYLNIKWNFENTPAPMRPQSLAWEIRKPCISTLPPTRAYKEMLSLTDSQRNPLSSEGCRSQHQRKLSVDDSQLVLRVGKPSEKQPELLIPIPKTSPPKYVDVELQTDIEGDPDIFYFAGGRTVSNQTDPLEEEFPPISLLLPSSDPISVIKEVVAEKEEGKDCKRKSKGIQVSLKEELKNEAKPKPVNKDLKEPESGEGVKLKPSENQAKTLPSPTTNKMAKSSSPLPPPIKLSESLEEKKTPELTEGPKSFADKTRDGIKKSNSTTKSYPSNLNTIGGGGGDDKTIGSKGKMAGGVNYRSNIASRCRTAAHYKTNNASRCRTAANTGQLSQSQTQVLPQQGPKVGKPTISASCPKSTTNLNTTRKVAESKAPLSSCSASKYASSFQTFNDLTAGDKNNKGAKTGAITRSKSMINPSGVGRGRMLANYKAQFPKTQEKMNSNSSLNSPHSSAQTPTDTTPSKRRHNIDEDGWETVRTRSNRSSKWSASTSSLHSTLSRGSVDKGSEKIEGRKSIESSPDQLTEKEEKNSERKEKEGEDESSNDDEEIKQKDEALDCAMREEELLEEELRQVEKNIDDLEKRGEGYELTTSETETAPSPDSLETSKENSEDNYFFVSVDGDKTLGLAKVDDFSPREPGRIVALREKLLSPAKRMETPSEALKRHQEKLAKAERNRERRLKVQVKKYVELSERFNALNETTKSLVQERAELLTRAEERRRRAEEKREFHLSEIKKKAHDEYSKQMEIRFINSFELESRKHDLAASALAAEERIQGILEERKQKIDERSIRAQKVIQRQFQNRRKWNKKLEKMQEKRRKNEERIEREKEEKAKEKAELAQEKARDREERLTAINTAKQIEKIELQKKIQQKQEDTARRHEENMEQIRQKAAELSTPRATTEDTIPICTVRVCTICKVLVQSEVQELAHLRGRAHLDGVKKLENGASAEGGMGGFGIKYIIDVQADKLEKGMQPDKNRTKALRKICKKTHQKLIESGQEFENGFKSKHKEDKISGDPAIKNKFTKNLQEIDRIIGLFNQNKGTTALATSLDRALKAIRKSTNKCKVIKDSLRLDAFRVVQKVLESEASDLPQRTKIIACQFLIAGSFEHLENAIYIIRSTCICSIIQIMVNQWNAIVPEENRFALCRTPNDNVSRLPFDLLLEEVSELFFTLMNFIAHPSGIGNPKHANTETLEVKEVVNRTLDIVGYYVASGVVDRLSIYCSGIVGTVESQPNATNLLNHSLNTVTLLIYTLLFCLNKKAEWTKKKEVDTTQYVYALESSELAGSIAMAYSLLHQGAFVRSRVLESGENETLLDPPELEESTANLVTLTLQLVNSLARYDLKHLQNLLGSESISLQFRHISSQLLWQLIPRREIYSYRRLLLELLMAIGYFTVVNPHNQEIIQSGQNPTVLQQLCALPKDFMEDPKYSKYYIPTLIVATHGCPENLEILKQHGIDSKAHEEYMKSENGKIHPLIVKLHELTRDKENSILTPKKPKC